MSLCACSCAALVLLCWVLLGMPSHGPQGLTMRHVHL